MSYFTQRQSFSLYVFIASHKNEWKRVIEDFITVSKFSAISTVFNFALIYTFYIQDTLMYPLFIKITRIIRNKRITMIIRCLSLLQLYSPQTIRIQLLQTPDKNETLILNVSSELTSHVSTFTRLTWSSTSGFRKILQASTRRESCEMR